MFRFPAGLPRLPPPAVPPVVPAPVPVVPIVPLPLPPQHIPKLACSIKLCDKQQNDTFGADTELFPFCNQYVFSFTYNNGLFLSVTDNGRGVQMRALVDVEGPLVLYDQSNVILKTRQGMGADYVRLTFPRDAHLLYKMEWISSVCNRTSGPNPPRQQCTELGTLEEYQILNYYGGNYPQLVPANFHYDANDFSAVALRL